MNYVFLTQSPMDLDGWQEAPPLTMYLSTPFITVSKQLGHTCQNPLNKCLINGSIIISSSDVSPHL